MDLPSIRDDLTRGIPVELTAYPTSSSLPYIQETSVSYQVSSLSVLAPRRPPLSLSLSLFQGLRCCSRPKEGNLSTGDKTRSDLRESERVREGGRARGRSLALISSSFNQSTASDINKSRELNTQPTIPVCAPQIAENQTFVPPIQGRGNARK